VTEFNLGLIVPERYRASSSVKYNKKELKQANVAKNANISPL